MLCAVLCCAGLTLPPDRPDEPYAHRVRASATRLSSEPSRARHLWAYGPVPGRPAADQAIVATHLWLDRLSSCMRAPCLLQLRLSKGTRYDVRDASLSFWPPWRSDPRNQSLLRAHILPRLPRLTNRVSLSCGIRARGTESQILLAILASSERQRVSDRSGSQYSRDTRSDRLLASSPVAVVMRVSQA